MKTTFVLFILTDHLLKFISQNWGIITSIVIAFAYLIEKAVKHYKESRKKKEAYNKVFSGIVQLYYSYQKHQVIYLETPTVAFPNEIYALMVSNIDTFDKDIERFRKIIEEETNIIPEISLTT